MLDISFPNEATTIGSTPYYVVRFADPAVQQKLAALFLWKKQLQQLHALSDPGVARVKLQWWHQQIALPLATPSNHPLAASLSTLLHESTQAAEAFKLVYEETDRHLHRQTY